MDETHRSEDARAARRANGANEAREANGVSEAREAPVALDVARACDARGAVVADAAGAAGATSPGVGSHALADVLLDSMEQAVAVIDRAHKVVRANRAAFELHGADLLGRTCREVLPGCEDDGGACPGCETLATGQAHARDQVLPPGAADGVVSVRTFALRSDGAAVDGIVRMDRRPATPDVRVQAQMVHNERMAAFGMLAAGMAHEIGNPLAAIASQIDVARRLPDARRVAQTLSVVEHEVQRIARLLRDLGDLSRPGGGDAAMLSVNQIVEDVARLLAHDPRARNVRIEVGLADELPGLRARKDPLVQVLLNLGINALDAVRGAGRVVFETGHGEDGVLVRVRDSGTGVPPAARARLFEPFFTTKAVGRGTGLGLFVSRGIVEGMGGTLTLESQDGCGGVCGCGREDAGAGCGAVFAVRLPVRAAAVAG